MSRADGAIRPAKAALAAMLLFAPVGVAAKAQTGATQRVGENRMITAIVRFPLAKTVSRDDAKALFERSAPAYREAPGLVRKYYLYGEGPVGGGVYLWKDRTAAETFYSPEWRKGLAERVGAEPEIAYFETPVIVDNVKGAIE